MANKKQSAPEPQHPLGKFDFQCEKCKAVHHKSVYCIAQQASGNAITFTCTCGHKMDVPE